MADPNEIRALKASVRGALDTGVALSALQGKVEAVDEHGEIEPDLLEELTRVVAAHAVAAAALRGLLDTINARRAESTAT